MTTSSTNRIAIVTGGSRGIGRATALHLARAGVDSIITYRSNAGDADDVVKSIVDLGQTAVALPLDLGAMDSFDEFVTAVPAHSATPGVGTPSTSSSTTAERSGPDRSPMPPRPTSTRS